MFGQLNQAVEEFHDKWHKLVESRTNRQFFCDLRPTGVAWKTEDLAEFDLLFNQLRQESEQVHTAWVNERWLATFYLREPHFGNIRIVKLMQRRKGSDDPIGLDHVDFYSPAVKDAEKVLQNEPELKWSHESNGEHCSWISIWFDGTEAKLRTNTTLDICIKEMQIAANHIIETA